VIFPTGLAVTLGATGSRKSPLSLNFSMPLLVSAWRGDCHVGYTKWGRAVA
jgi:hypothetical protein